MSGVPCGAPTKKGGVCHNHRWTDDASGCVWHDSTEAGEREREKLRRAGRLKSSAIRKLTKEAPAPPTTLAECIAFQSWIAGALARRFIDAADAKALTASVKEVERLLAVRDSEGKLNALVARADALKQK
jgi:hypothetical protein